jgi:8-amino-7-oxononanoate synthase
MSEIEERLAELERSGLDRRLRMVSGPQGPTVLLDGRPVLLLCSNNYLGLADHPRVREAAAEAAMRWGVGAGASRLVSGTMTIHRRLEERLAAFERSEACLLFGSGYLANIGVIGALAGPGDTVFSDELNHASIVDGCRLSRAEVVVYRHADPDHLAFSLRRHGGRGRRLIVTDSVFSMDGDLAPLEEIVELASAYGARTMVDEAHATGALGPDGRGALARAGLQGEVDVLVGTLGKALGSYGAYVCGDSQMVRYLVNTARPLIFSTAPPPPAVAAALAALELLQERPHRVERLRSNALLLRRELAAVGFSVAEEGMHIVPLIVGEERMTMRLCQEAIERGVFAQAIRPPTVAAGTSRMRLAVMASHAASELRTAARVLGEAAHAVGLDPAEIGTPLRERGVADVAPSLGVLEAPSADLEPFSLGVEREAPETGPNPGRARLAAAARSRSDGPFDLEKREAAGEPAPARGAHEPDAPFDIERETAVQRAA